MSTDIRNRKPRPAFHPARKASQLDPTEALQ